MSVEQIRKMRFSEREKLKSLAGYVDWKRYTVRAAAFFLVLTPISIVLHSFGLPALLLMLVSLGIALVAAKSWHHVDREMIEDIRGNEVVQREFDVRKVFKLSEWEDSGPALLLDLKGETLFLEGQYLNDVPRMGHSKIQCVCSMRSNIILDISWSGEPIPIIQLELNSMDLRQKAGMELYDGQVLSSEVESLVK